MWARHTGLPTSLGSHQVLPVHSAYVLTCLLTYHVPAHSAEAHLHPNVPPCGKGIASKGIAYTPLQGVQGRGGLQWGCRVGRRAQSKSTSDLGLSEASAGRSAGAQPGVDRARVQPGGLHARLIRAVRPWGPGP